MNVFDDTNTPGGEPFDDGLTDAERQKLIDEGFERRRLPEAATNTDPAITQDRYLLPKKVDPDAGKKRKPIPTPKLNVMFKTDNPTRIRNLLLPNNLLKFTPPEIGSDPTFKSVENRDFVPKKQRVLPTFRVRVEND